MKQAEEIPPAAIKRLWGRGVNSLQIALVAVVFSVFRLLSFGLRAALPEVAHIQHWAVETNKLRKWSGKHQEWEEEVLF